MFESSPFISQLYQAARQTDQMPPLEVSQLLRRATDLLRALRESVGEAEWDHEQAALREALAAPSVIGSLPKDLVGQLLTDAAEAIHRRQVVLLSTAEQKHRPH